ncbi:cation diffusion facilitator family transporter [Pedobacter yulinensis]|uniref:Cation diffusion facilitator family transporter n=1 Tax=Pedobacter yulinensis TaxID=2126353 RepID=A0A2T3HLM6_9SPHI|nr:cation diffusion facilitator family transporter [Pedobacter yulinensis]PST83326.1 cation diffusion facilitator family transporter [Pedobacter yulinensis]
MTKRKKAIVISLCISVLLMLAKFTAFFISGSNAILTDAAESIVNVIASSFAFYSVYLSTRPRDENHPYGHGKVEFFSAFVEGTLILIAGIIIIGKSIYSILSPEPLQQLFEGTLIIAIAGLINLVTGLFLIRTGRQENSMALVADGRHLLTDTYTSAALVVGLVLMLLTDLYWLDSLLSVAAGLYIVFTGYKLTRESVGGLMDESDLKLVSAVVDILQDHRADAWIDVHNLRTQQYGPELHIDCHVTLPYYYDLTRVHKEISDIDDLINEKKLRETELFIHADPCLPQCCHYCRMKDCPVRQEPQSKDFTWTIENTTRNKKHFENELL